MSRQDKATTERNARILRDLVKQPENKSCADCKRNDTRWASWNLGLYLCIRCSGIHRSMGTHISKVKSIDLDIWTPEQMENIQRWGNTRANKYWERHLKAGHVPPDQIFHSVQVRVPPLGNGRSTPDPATLDADTPSASAPAPAPASRPTSSAPTPTTTAPPPVPAHLPKAHPLLSRSVAAGKASPSKPTPAAKAPIIDLFGDDDAAPAPTAAKAPTQVPATSAPAPAPAPGSSMFDLDFRAPSATPSSTTSPQPSAPAPKSAKADIMSLFSTPSPAASASTGGPNLAGGFFAPPGGVQAGSQYASWGGGVTSSAPPVQHNPTQAPLPQSNVWGGFNDQAAWGAPQAQVQPQQPQQQAVQPPLYAQPQSAQQNVSANPWTMSGGSGASADPWASNASGGGAGAGFFGVGSGAAQAQPQQAKKDDRDPFANIWA